MGSSGVLAALGSCPALAYDARMKVFSIMPLVDWLALAVFVLLWVGYAWFARFWGLRTPSLMATTQRYRRLWMLQSTARDPRVLDGIITQSLSNNPSFLASTSILVIGGLAAVLGTTDRAAELVREIPFAEATPMLVFEFKILVLVSVFVFAFFRFTWSMRQYVIAGVVIGAMPSAKEFEQAEAAAGAAPAAGAQSFDVLDRDAVANRVAALLGLAADTFNDGLRAYYFAFAALCWFLSPAFFMVGTLLVILVLYSREFRSDVLQVLRD